MGFQEFLHVPSFCIKKYPKLCQKVAVLSQLKPFAGKGSQTSFLFKKKTKKCSLNVLRLSKTSCFDIQRKFVFCLATSLLKNKDFEKEGGGKNPTTRPQPKFCFKDLGEPRSNSKPGIYGCSNRAAGFGKQPGVWWLEIWEKISSVVGSPVWLNIDTSGIQVYVGKIQK